MVYTVDNRKLKRLSNHFFLIIFLKNFFFSNLRFSFFQNWESETGNILNLIFLALVFLIVLAVSQFPSVLGSERIAALVSFLTVFGFAGDFLFIAFSKNAAVMFVLLLAVHAMLPISRISSFIVSSILLALFITFSLLHISGPPDWMYFRKVGFLRIYNRVPRKRQ